MSKANYQYGDQNRARTGWRGADASATIARDPMYQRLLPYRPERDIYTLLEVDPTADHRELNAAWLRLARTFHPDRNPSPRAHEEMQVVYAVRALLSDPHSRAAYDGQRRRFVEPSPGTSRAGSAVRSRRARTARAAWRRRTRALLLALRAALLALGTPRCPACGVATAASYRFCAECGAPLRTPETLTADQD